MIKGITYVNQKVPAAAHGAAFARLLSDGVLLGCNLTYTGSTLTVGAGLLIVAGREAQVVGSETVSLTNTSGYARVKAVINMGAVSTSESFKQFSLAVEYATTANGFTALKKEDINNGGVTYEAELAVLSLGTAGITGIIRQLGAAHAVPTQAEVSLPASGWSNKQQTVACAIVRSGDAPLVTYAPASRSVWNDAEIYATAVGDGTITFACETAPSAAVTALVRF